MRVDFLPHEELYMGIFSIQAHYDVNIQTNKK